MGNNKCKGRKAKALNAKPSLKLKANSVKGSSMRYGD